MSDGKAKQIGPRVAHDQRVADAYRELNRAARDAEPSCSDDPRFTMIRGRRLSASERKDLYLTCFSCPVYDYCSDYATLANPAAGFWAGKNYGTFERL